MAMDCVFSFIIIIIKRFFLILFIIIFVAVWFVHWLAHEKVFFLFFIFLFF